MGSARVAPPPDSLSDQSGVLPQSAPWGKGTYPFPMLTISPSRCVGVLSSPLDIAKPPTSGLLVSNHLMGKEKFLCSLREPNRPVPRQKRICGCIPRLFHMVFHRFCGELPPSPERGMPLVGQGRDRDWPDRAGWKQGSSGDCASSLSCRLLCRKATGAPSLGKVLLLVFRKQARYEEGLGKAKGRIFCRFTAIGYQGPEAGRLSWYPYSAVGLVARRCP